MHPVERVKRRARAIAMDPPRALRPLFSTVRHLRWRRAAWSSGGDREFHDRAFAGPEYFPFTFSYPGYVTIRRFADLAEPHIPRDARVLDIGCGPGEITCELAQRRRDARIVGIDHSASAVDRARRNAARLGLDNVSFHQQAAESYANGEKTDLVTMFDSFHHVPDPEGFVRSLERITDTVFLIEPSGNALGQWQPHIDADWVLTELDKVRMRIEHSFGVASARRRPGASGRETGASAGEAVERRYPLSEYERLFEGFGLSLQGTIAGFQQYPPDAFAESPLKAHFGRFVYDTIVELETQFVHGQRDLHAKHWAILARRGAPSRLPRFPSAIEPPAAAPAPLSGAWDVAYLAYEGPREGRAGQRVRGRVSLRNRSWRTWSSGGDAPIHASYHWASRGSVRVRDGLRSPLGADLLPGEERTLNLDLELPERPGAWELQIDLVEEHVTWFSEQGHPPLVIPFSVRE